MNRLNEIEKKYIINLIENGEQIPEDYKYMLFPNLQEEYELTYAGKMRKEDILAGEDGTFPVPLQIDRMLRARWRQIAVTSLQEYALTCPVLLAYALNSQLLLKW
ncbi:TPA: hypothetical protein VML09_001845 [Streptococcus pyogenes]|nr:hypothetical protein [Streptococcus pyogenes]HER8283140.1 hypothetical protein [Streptococcus pyogenes]